MKGRKEKKANNKLATGIANVEERWFTSLVKKKKKEEAGLVREGDSLRHYKQIWAASKWLGF